MQLEGDLYPYYQVPSRLKKLTENFFVRRKPAYEKMIAALNAEYNPIENYDRNRTLSTTDTETGSTESKVSAFDSATYQPAGKAEIADSKTHTETSRDHGNVGVTTSQQMINEELELRKIEMYRVIASEYEDEFLIRVY